MDEVNDVKENYSTGYIKLFRSIKNKGWYKKSDYVHLWIHILVKANHKKNEWMYKNKIINILPGQFITSRKTLRRETGINESKVERILKCFENEQQIEQQNMHTSRLISVNKWSEYQISEHVNEQRVNSERTASEQRVNTNNNVKNVKNDNNKSNHLFKKSKYYNNLTTIKQEIGDKYLIYNLSYYHESVKNWAESKGAMKKDWLAVIRNFILGDIKDNKAKEL